MPFFAFEYVGAEINLYIIYNRNTNNLNFTVMRRFTLLKSLFLAAVLAIGSSGAWAETVTLQLSSSTKFGTSSGSTLTQDGVEWTVNSSKGSINGS